MNILKKLKNNEFWSSVAKLSAGQIIGQTITLLATLVLSRIYTDSDYGIYGIIISTANIIISIISLALGSAIMVADNDEDSKRVFTVAYLLQMILLLIVFIVMCALMPVKQFFITPIAYPIALVIMMLYISLNVLYTMMRVYINRLKMNNVLFWNSLINAGCTVFISIPMGFFGFGFIGLISASLLAEAIAIILMMRAAFPFIKINGFADVKKTIKECKAFILFQYPSNFMGSVSNNMPNQTLYNLFGETALGTYSMCNKIFNMPLNLIMTPIQTVYFRTAAEMKNETDKLAEFTFSFLSKLTLIAAIPMIAVMAFGEYIFSFVLGSQWAEAGLIAAIMCPYFYFFFCYGCITYLRVSIGKQKVNLYTTMLQFIFSLTALIVSKLLSGGVIVTVGVFAAINTLYNLINIFISFACLKKYAFKYLISSTFFIIVCIAISIFIRLFI